jgi:magnesium transporter
MRTLITTRDSLRAPSDEDVAGRLAAASAEGFWLDIETPTDADFQMLEHSFNVHPLAIEDLRHGNQRPKMEEYPAHAFVVVFVPRWNGSELARQEHFLFVGPSYLVTVHTGESEPLAALMTRLARSPELSRGRPDFLAYLVIDALVDATFPVLDKLDDDVDALEDDIVERATPAQLHATYLLKHAVTDLRRILGAQRDAFQKLITHSADLQKQEVSLYYRDVYDHLVRQYEMVDSLRDLLTSAMDVYLSTVSNRVNETMKTLTVIASLFLPLTFFTGFFGMNFSYLVENLEHGKAVFWSGMIFMLAATALQFIMFRRRKWI